MEGAAVGDGDADGKSLRGRRGPTTPALQRETRGAEGVPRGPRSSPRVVGSHHQHRHPSPAPGLLLPCPVSTLRKAPPSPRPVSSRRRLCWNPSWSLPGPAVFPGARPRPLRPGPRLPPWSPQPAAPQQPGGACQRPQPSRTPTSLGAGAYALPTAHEALLPAPALCSGHTATRAPSLALPPQSLCTNRPCCPHISLSSPSGLLCATGTMATARPTTRGRGVLHVRAGVPRLRRPICLSHRPWLLCATAPPQSLLGESHSHPTPSAHPQRSQELGRG